MNRRNFSPSEVELLLKNPNVSKCSDKAITYAKHFKVWAVKRYLEYGMTPSQIFIEAGFEKFCLDKDVPKDRLRAWRRVYALKGIDALSVERRGGGGKGGRPKSTGLSEEERIKRLEMEVAYLKAENAFLAKLRAKRRESNFGPFRNTGS